MKRGEMVPVESVDVEGKPRVTFGAGDDKNLNLLKSMQEQGQLQPILVAPRGDGSHELIFGGRRLAAAKRLGWTEIWADVREIKPEEREFSGLAENLFRLGPKNREDYHLNLRKWYEFHTRQNGGASDASVAAAGRTRARTEGGTFQKGNDQPPPSPTSAKFASVGEAEDEAGEEPSEACAPPEKPDPFWNRVQGATGGSERRAKYDAAIARAFDEKQLLILHAAGVNDEGMRLLAGIKNDIERDLAVHSIAMGFSPEDAKRRAAEKVSGKAAKPPAEMTDQEWLEIECGEIRGRLRDTAIFDQAAKTYRALRSQVAVLKKVSKPILEKNGRSGVKDPFTARMFVMITGKHPKDWLVCGECDGGRRFQDGSCPECRGAGFKLSHGK